MDLEIGETSPRMQVPIYTIFLFLRAPFPNLLILYVHSLSNTNYLLVNHIQVYNDVARVAVFDGLTTLDPISREEGSRLKKKRPSFSFTVSWETSTCLVLLNLSRKV